MKFILTVVLFVIVASTGCTAIQWANNNPAQADAAIRIGVSQFISATDNPDEVQKRAERVNERANNWLKLLDENPEITLDDFETKIRQEINWVDMPVSDQVLLDVLIINIRMQLDKQVDDLVIPEDYSIRLKTLLAVVIQTTKLYGL
jgi:hypothetical protein